MRSRVDTLGGAIEALDTQMFVGREPEVAAFRHWLSGTRGQPEILHICGPGGVGKSALLQEFGRIATSTGHPVVHLDGREMPSTPRGLLRALGHPTLDATVAKLNRENPLVLIDTFEALGDLTPYLQRDFLPRLGTGVKLVLAGRYPLGLAWSAWHQLIRSLVLEGFSSTVSRAYLARRGMADPCLTDQIVEATGGYPLALALVADLVLQRGVRNLAEAPEWHRIVRALVEQVLRDLPVPGLRELLEAGALVRQFDEATLAAVSGREEISAAFDQVCRLSLVRCAPHGLALHQDLRRIIVQDLLWRRPERYDELRRRAQAYYRNRTEVASPADREWLLTEWLGLCEDAVVRSLVFSEVEPGPVWLDTGRAEDLRDVQRIWAEYVQDALATTGASPGDRRMADADLAALVRQPATQVTLARDRDGRAVGFLTMMPICQETLPILRGRQYLGALLEAYWSPSQLARLPRTGGEATVYYLLHLAHTHLEPIATRAALVRRMFELLARGGVYFAATAIPAHKSLLESLGFQIIPQARRWPWGEEHAVDGYVLDLARIGLEQWVEALQSGRHPPRRLARGELEGELQEALAHWHDEDWLAGSPLAEYFAPRTGGPEATPEAVRGAVRDAVGRLRAQGSPEQALALRALELGYFGRKACHERAAEDLAISRSTFYRLLRRGVRDLAAIMTTR